MFRMIRTAARRVLHTMGRVARSYCEHMVVMDPSGHAMYPSF